MWIPAYNSCVVKTLKPYVLDDVEFPNFDFKFSTKVGPVQYLYERSALRFIVGKQSGTWSGVVVTSF